VADAVTRLRMSRAGQWRMWVRCKDWDPTSPGRFQVWLGGRASTVTLGTYKGGWAWADGGIVDLPAGDVKVRLKDLTGLLRPLRRHSAVCGRRLAAAR